MPVVPKKVGLPLELLDLGALKKPANIFENHKWWRQEIKELHEGGDEITLILNTSSGSNGAPRLTWESCRQDLNAQQLLPKAGTFDVKCDEGMIRRIA